MPPHQNRSRSRPSPRRQPVAPKSGSKSKKRGKSEFQSESVSKKAKTNARNWKMVPNEEELKRAMYDGFVRESGRSKRFTPIGLTGFQNAFEEYKKFMHLKAQLKDFGGDRPLRLSPCPRVDIIWHAHILHTHSYMKFCDALSSGAFFHHDPCGASDSEAKERSLRRMATRIAYEAKFGEAPPANVWGGDFGFDSNDDSSPSHVPNPTSNGKSGFIGDEDPARKRSESSRRRSDVVNLADDSDGLSDSGPSAPSCSKSSSDAKADALERDGEAATAEKDPPAGHATVTDGDESVGEKSFVDVFVRTLNDETWNFVMARRGEHFSNLIFRFANRYNRGGSHLDRPGWYFLFRGQRVERDFTFEELMRKHGFRGVNSITVYALMPLRGC